MPSLLQRLQPVQLSHLPKGFDPENPTNYIWAYPKTRSFTFGVNIGF